MSILLKFKTRVKPSVRVPHLAICASLSIVVQCFLRTLKKEKKSLQHYLWSSCWSKIRFEGGEWWILCLIR